MTTPLPDNKLDELFGQTVNIDGHDYLIAKPNAKEKIRQLLLEARITALTDVDNLNLLNESDAWHNFYMDEISKFKAQKEMI